MTDRPLAPDGMQNAVLDGLAQALGAAAVGDIVEMFAVSSRTTLHRMAQAAAKPLALAQEAHALAGSAACIGLTDLAVASRALEYGLRAGPVADPERQITMLRDLCSMEVSKLVLYRTGGVRGFNTPSG